MYSNYRDQLGNIPHIDYKELEAATDGWSQHRVLGSGGFGTVYRGTWKNTTWAIKRITQVSCYSGPVPSRPRLHRGGLGERRPAGMAGGRGYYGVDCQIGRQEGVAVWLMVCLYSVRLYLFYMRSGKKYSGRD